MSIVLVGFSVLAAATQSVSVKANFEIDGKETKDKFRIVLYVDSIATEPTVFDDGSFFVPPLDVKTVDVQLISGKYNLLYKDVYVAKLRGTLTFDVKQDFSDTDSRCKPGEKLVKFYSLEFDPGDGDGTVMTVNVCN